MTTPSTSTGPTPADAPELFHPSEDARISFALQVITDLMAELPATHRKQQAVLAWVIRVLINRRTNLRVLGTTFEDTAQ